MDRQHRGKLNQLLQQWPRETVTTSARLNALGVSRQLANKYVRSGWIVKLGGVTSGQVVYEADRIVLG